MGNRAPQWAEMSLPAQKKEREMGCEMISLHKDSAACAELGGREMAMIYGGSSLQAWPTFHKKHSQAVLPCPGFTGILLQVWCGKGLGNGSVSSPFGGGGRGVGPQQIAVESSGARVA